MTILLGILAALLLAGAIIGFAARQAIRQEEPSRRGQPYGGETGGGSDAGSLDAGGGFGCTTSGDGGGGDCGGGGGDGGGGGGD